MKHQGYKDKHDESMGMRRKKCATKRTQSATARRHEAEGMEKHYGRKSAVAHSKEEKPRKSVARSYSLRGKDDYDRSPKHRRRESEGMKRYWRDK